MTSAAATSSSITPKRRPTPDLPPARARRGSCARRPAGDRTRRVTRHAGPSGPRSAIKQEVRGGNDATGLAAETRGEERWPFHLLAGAILLDAGLQVAEQPGWKNSGRGDVGPIKGVICHRTAGALAGNMPSLGIIINGRPDLPGPLVAARARTTAPTSWSPPVDVTMRAAIAGLYRRQHQFHRHRSGEHGHTADRRTTLGPPFRWMPTAGVAAILKKIRANAIMCAGHKEYALPQGRKPDPNFDMNQFRQQVAAIMAGAAPIPRHSPVPSAQAGRHSDAAARAIWSGRSRPGSTSPRPALSTAPPKRRYAVSTR